MNRNRVSIRVAIVLVTALIFFIEHSAHGEKRSTDPQVETIIERAQQRLLRKDRQGALSLLRSQEIRLKEPHLVDQLRKEGQRLAKIFLTDKGQRSYELSFTLLRENGAQALDKLKEASVVEDGHADIQMLMVRLELFLGNCKRAEALLNNFKEMAWLYPEDSLELQVSLASCSDEKSGLAAVTKDAHFKKLTVSPYVMGLLAVHSGAREAATRRFLEMTEKDPQFPLSWYWLWKLERAQSLKRNYGRRYQSLCEGEELPLGRYKNFPARCKNLAEVKEDISQESSDASNDEQD